MMELKKLPDAEFEIMKAVWNSDEPVTAPQLTEKLKGLLPDKDWKQQTIQTMLIRLEKKGFLRSEKAGKERNFFAAVAQEAYLKVESESFRERFKNGSFSGLVKALYDSGEVTDKDVAELKKWLDEV
ncbi:MAG: BlaI/MecI/CopY family transcriptional regulator [Oscillospiraceae bacterium]